MLGKNDVMLSGEDLNSIAVGFLNICTRKYDDNCIACIREISYECIGNKLKLGKSYHVSMLQSS